MNRLLEYTRSQLVSQSRRAKKEKDGKTRYEKRVKSRIGTSVKNFNNINMNSVFKEDILTVGIDVKGETDDYVVTISFGGFLDNLHKQLGDREDLTLRDIIRALVRSFNGDNVYVRCTCPDFFYRFGYFLSKDDIIYGERQDIPSDITNPDNDLGRGCKHIMLALSNHSWLIKVASAVNNYIHYMEKHYTKLYQTVIYPAIYDKEYEGDIQLDIFDDDELATSKQDIEKANEYGGRRTQFQKGNEYRFRPREKDTDQIEMEDEVEEEG